jgi:hypothetical protein
MSVATLTKRYPVLYINYYSGEWVVMASSGVLDPVQQLSTGLTLDSAIENAIKDTTCQVHKKPAAGIVSRAVAQVDKWLSSSSTPPIPQARGISIERKLRQARLLEKMMKPKVEKKSVKKPPSRIF